MKMYHSSKNSKPFPRLKKGGHIFTTAVENKLTSGCFRDGRVHCLSGLSVCVLLRGDRKWSRNLPLLALQNSTSLSLPQELGPHVLSLPVHGSSRAVPQNPSWNPFCIHPSFGFDLDPAGVGKAVRWGCFAPQKGLHFKSAVFCVSWSFVGLFAEDSLENLCLNSCSVFVQWPCELKRGGVPHCVESITAGV